LCGVYEIDEAICMPNTIIIIQVLLEKMRKIGGGRQVQNTKTAGKDNSTFYHSTKDYD